MSSRYQSTGAIASGSIAAGATLNINTTGLPSLFNIHKITVVPDSAGGSFDYRIYKADTFAAAKLLALWDNVANGTTGLVDPMDDTSGVPAAANEGAGIPYDDDDDTGELHHQIINNDGTSHTYTITILYEEVPKVVSVGSYQARSTAPRWMWYEDGVGADLKQWDAIVDASVLSFRTRTDADGAGVTWMSVTRGATTAVTSVTMHTRYLFSGAGTGFAPVNDNADDNGGAATRWRTGYFGTALAVGTSPATTGAIRLAYTANIYFRNNDPVDAAVLGMDTYSTVANTLAVGASGTARIWLNPNSNDTDVFISSDTNVNQAVFDSGAFGGVGAMSLGRAIAGHFILIGSQALTIGANDNHATINIANEGSVTVPTGTSAWVVSANFEEPNITATGTVSDAYTVRIGGAPTEGTRSGSLWVVSGAVDLGVNTNHAGMFYTGSDSLADHYLDTAVTSAVGSTFTFRKARGTQAARTIVAEDDVVGSFDFQAIEDATDYRTVAQIIAKVGGTPGAAVDMPGKLEFYTTPDASTTPALAMTITRTQTIAAGLAANATGHIYVGSNVQSTVYYDTAVDSAVGSALLFRKARGTQASRTIVADGDTLGSLYFYGIEDATDYRIAAQIQAKIDGTPGAATDMPGRLEFYTTPDGSVTPTLAMTINSSQNLGLGTQTFGTSAAKVLGIFNGTEPSTSPADMVQLYSVDLSADNATLGLRTETAVAVDALLASTHTLSVRINGTTYKILLST